MDIDNHPGRGGRREGAGRKPSNKPRKTEHTVTLDEETVNALKAISSNLSEAIRIVVSERKENGKGI